MTKQLGFVLFVWEKRRKGALVLGLVACMLGLGLSASARRGTYISFDAPGAGTAAYQGSVQARK
jgi:hypothetical protein